MSTPEINLFDFEWKVNVKGYRIDNVKNEGFFGKVSIEPTIVYSDFREKRTFRPYSPTREHPNLHRLFADSVVDAPTALLFVQRFGFLGNACPYPLGDDEDGELVEFILKERFKIKNVLDRIETLYKSKRRDAVAVERLAEVFKESASSGMSIRLTQPKSDRLSISYHFVPVNLIGWMWLRVAQEATQEKEWRECANPRCKEVFEVNLNDGRSKNKKIFCARVACRQAVRREKLRTKMT